MLRCWRLPAGSEAFFELVWCTSTGCQARTLQTGTLGNYLNQFVRLNLSSVQINAFGMTFVLNPGEANNFFPEERRCVVFQAVP